MMRKRCISGHINPPEEMLCTQCGADMRFAEEVYEPDTDTANPAPVPTQPPPTFTPGQPAAAPDPVHRPAHDETRASNQAACTCRFPGGAPGSICFACHGTIPAAGEAPGATAPPDAEATDEPQAPRRDTGSPSNLRLRLPNQVSVAVGADLLLGRGAEVPSREVAWALAPYKGVSHRHAMLLMSEGQARLIDLGSRNGTWVESHRLTPFVPFDVPLSSQGARIRLGLNATLLIEEEE